MILSPKAPYGTGRRMDLVFASQNPHKLEEVRASLGPRFPVVDLNSLGWTAEIPETAETLLGNARLKAQTVFNELKRDCFADDTGLEIEALGGQPGVRTARFAGEGATGSQNREKTLKLMASQNNRRATFITVIVLIQNGVEHVFEGRIEGEILREEKGEAGMAYSPIFRPLGSARTLAEMSVEERAKVSHRARALARMRKFLEGQS